MTASSDRNSPARLWERHKRHLCSLPSLGFALDISRMDFADGFFAAMEPRIQRAYDAMAGLESGAIANPDEKRMVGHYWLRTPELAPNAEIAAAIRGSQSEVKKLAAATHGGERRSPLGERYANALVIGIGGSALGPQLAADALGSAADKIRVLFLDNTDPDGIDRVLGSLQGQLGKTIPIVISKSGGTPETRNGMIETEAAYRRAGLTFADFAVAITGTDGALFEKATRENWKPILPMWDWVGGRTSIFSNVGLVPAALQGIDIDAFISGAREMDAATRSRETAKNPAALLALMWHHAGGGRGAKDMVVLPYKDRLVLFSKYLQQLVMESLGKEKDLDGQIVNQGIAVYGNKGSTDQHAYVQQLRDGVNNFFATFIEVLKDRDGESVEVEPGVTSGDYLGGLLLGTRRALYENGRESMTITIPEVSPRSLGALIALFERAVGFYATLVNINAYHQPGVEAGKKAAKAALEIQAAALQTLRSRKDEPLTADAIADAIGKPYEAETIFKILDRLGANPSSGVAKSASQSFFEAKYSLNQDKRSVTA